MVKTSSPRARSTTVHGVHGGPAHAATFALTNTPRFSRLSPKVRFLLGQRWDLGRSSGNSSWWQQIHFGVGAEPKTSRETPTTRNPLLKCSSAKPTPRLRIRSRTANHPPNKKPDEILSHRQLSSPQTPHPPHPFTMLQSTESHCKLLHGSCPNFGQGAGGGSNGGHEGAIK